MTERSTGITLAREDFQRARQRASLQEILSRLTGKSVDLLSYEDIRQKLHAVGGGISRGIQDIPLDSIVGSVGRYADFTRTFLPRNASDEDRWSQVMALVADPSGGGLPPIEVIKVGDAYFVQDGHHRVSVARQLGAKTIQAYVKEVFIKVPLSPDVNPDDLILKEEYTNFLERTGIQTDRSDANLELTVPGMYDDLVEHIKAHQYFMGLEEKREVPLNRAAAHWYDNVYLPVMEAIREQGILREFPGRTETDLYLWVSKHRVDLQQGIGDFISAESAASDLAERYGTSTSRVAARIGKSLAGAVVPAILESGPPPGAWHAGKVSEDSDRLFERLLVPINGEESGWSALDQALIFAGHEGSRIYGLHIVRDGEEADENRIQSLRNEFVRRCEKAGLSGGLAVEKGEVAQTICKRALLADLVIVQLSHAPSPQPIIRLGSGFRTLIRRCPRPIFAVPRAPTPLKRGLLAYDGSPKSKEALFVAAYITAHWNVYLTVLSVEQRGIDAEDVMEEADEYLQTRGVQAGKILKSGAVSEVILQTATETRSEWLLMGGYGSHPVVEAVLGSEVDVVLRESQLPILVCR
jgi:nucleotide-binding universal stress UspA family protein